jgi:hypothetical protein
VAQGECGVVNACFCACVMPSPRLSHRHVATPHQCVAPPPGRNQQAAAELCGAVPAVWTARVCSGSGSWHRLPGPVRGAGCARVWGWGEGTHRTRA